VSLKDLDNIIDSGGKLTPMMDQYYQIKKNYPNTLLLFRMGDFYEVFFEDARTASKFLSITLTHRGKIGDTPIPMAGIPHHAANAYIDRLTNRGLKVAICEQVQDPKDAQGIVKRAVTQVVSPGMPYDLEKTSGNEQRYMLSAFKNETSYFISAIDFTTGEFKGFKLKSFEEFLEIIRLLSPKEFITYMGQWNDKNINYQIDNILNHFDVLKTHLSEEYFDSKFTEFYIEKLIPSFKRDKILKKDPAILNAVGALAYYISSTQLIEQFIHVKPFQLTANDGLMKVTHPTLTGLEILPKNRETYNESLLGFFDKTETAMGSRKLKNIFSTPLLDPTRIDERLNIVESFIQESHLIDDCKVELSKIRDIDRILAKISMNKGSASDLLNISNAIFSYENINNLTKNLKIKNEVKVSDFNELKKIAIEIINTINDEIGAGLDKGNLIKDGVNSERDRLKNLHVNVGDALIEMENKLKVETGILKLRIKSNNVSGFFIEVSKGSTTKVPDYFDRRQTLVNAERYTTPSLLQLEKETITAQDKLEKLEREIFKSLINQIGINSNIIQIMGEMIAQIDVFQSFATISIRENLVRPTFN
jgi:DNA mismatch repair protein MutS